MPPAPIPSPRALGWDELIVPTATAPEAPAIEPADALSALGEPVEHFEPDPPKAKEPYLARFLMNYADVCDNPPALAPVLIGGKVQGILRCGHVMLITAASKAGKTYLLIELALALAGGHNWLGYHCRKGRVLVLNMEVDAGSYKNRIDKVREANRAYALSPAENLQVLNLRSEPDGITIGSDEPGSDLRALVTELVESVAAKAGAPARGYYEAVIIDPFYIVFDGDENNAGDVKAALREFDRITEDLGCAVITCHHHSKGAQAGKASMDRGSGSGVFARKPDAIIDLAPLDADEEDHKRMKEFDSDGAPFRVTYTLREFPTPDPHDVVFKYPLHVVPDPRAHLENLDVVGTKSAAAKAKQDDRWYRNMNRIIGEAIDQLRADQKEPTAAALVERLDAMGAKSKKGKTITKDALRKLWGDPRCDYHSVRSYAVANLWVITRKPANADAGEDQDAPAEKGEEDLD